MKKKRKSRAIEAMRCLLMAVGLSVVLGAVFALIKLINSSNFFSNFIFMTEVMFIAFFAGLAVAAILLLITNVPSELCIGYGAALYYGTFGGRICLKKWFGIQESVAFFIGFVITILICYIVWLKQFKDRYEDDEY